MKFAIILPALLLIASECLAVPAPKVWLKADAITGLANGAQVATWTDSSGNGFDATQATASERPIYVTNAISGKPVVRFDSASINHLVINRPVQDDFTIVCVFRSSQGLSSSYSWYNGAGLVDGEVGGATTDFGLSLNADGKLLAGTGAPDVFLNSASGYNDSSSHVATFTRTKSTGTIALYVDGTACGTVTGSTASLTAPSRLTIGSIQTDTNYFSGDIAEIIIYSSALSDADRSSVESSLLTKWYAPPTKTAKPTFTPAQGGYVQPQSVTISCSTPNAIIHYTTDGSTPTASSPLYTGPFTADKRVNIIKACASAPGLDDSDVASTSYAIVDFSWVKGANYVPSNAVNDVQQWEEFDPVIVDREMRYAKTYGFNTMRCFMNYIVWQKDRIAFLNSIEQFLTIADSYAIKTEFVFFDDCFDGNPHLAPQDPPIPGDHNSRWVQSPGDYVKTNYATYRPLLKQYVQDIVSAHKDDPRIAFWELYNEPTGGSVTLTLLADSRQWVQETGTSIPMTATGSGFAGDPFSDFLSFHVYGGYGGVERGAAVLCTECMNRPSMSVLGVVNYFNGKMGYTVWELCIGRDNTRFPWGSPQGAPEPTTPFHGVIYPDGHPWSVDDVIAVRGGWDNLRVFSVDYFNGVFSEAKKSSITPTIDFDLGNESGTGSPDASAGIGIDNFSIRWTGKLAASQTGTHTFFIDTDGIAGLWIDGVKIVDKPAHGRSEVTGTANLVAGQVHTVKVEYMHATGDSSVHVKWSGPGMSKRVLEPTYSMTVYTITASAGAHGVISPAGNMSVESGGSQTFAITPDPGYGIIDVVVDGVSRGPISSYTFADVTGNHMISAAFGVTASSISDIKTKPVGTELTLLGTQTVIYAPTNGGVRTTDFYYAAEKQGLGGLRVVDNRSNASLALGQTVTRLSGIVRKAGNGEVYLEQMGAPVLGEIAPIRPVATNNRAAISDSKVLANAIKVWGKAAYLAGADTLTIDDGYGKPITVKINGITVPSDLSGAFVTVTGVLSLDDVGAGTTNLVTNGGFEQNGGNGTAPAGWTKIINSYGAYSGGGAVQPHSGSFLLHPGSDSNSGAIYQNVTLGAGAYQIGLWAENFSGEPGAGQAGVRIGKALSLTPNQTNEDNLTLNDGSVINKKYPAPLTIWLQSVDTFSVATSGVYRLTLFNPIPDGNSVNLDDVWIVLMIQPSDRPVLQAQDIVSYK